ncbi:MAG: Bax inhibitor-1/YccA family protein [Terricaulis sp.]
MSDYNPQARSIPAQTDMSVDAGLRAFMLGVYNKMGLGLVVSAAVAFAVATTPALLQFFFTGPMAYVSIFAPVAIILISSFAMRNPSPASINIIYWSYVATMGLSLAFISAVYAAGYGGGFITVIKAFLISAAAFGALSLWGYTTKRDLSGFGTFLFMGVIGLLIAMVVNMFLQSPALDFVISGVGVLVFAGLTAFKTQMLKWSYYQLAGDARQLAVQTTYGALSLYITFMNLFFFILRILGGRR